MLKNKYNFLFTYHTIIVTDRLQIFQLIEYNIEPCGEFVVATLDSENNFSMYFLHKYPSKRFILLATVTCVT